LSEGLRIIKLRPNEKRILLGRGGGSAIRFAAAVALLAGIVTVWLVYDALAGVTGSHHSRRAAKLVFVDEFTGRAGAPPDPSKWQVVTGGGGWGNSELESYTSRSSNVALDGKGHLAITARRETYTGADGVTRYYTSARLQTKGLFESAYGELEARIKLPRGRGLWPAFWALGSNIDSVGWPACGEIDMMENLGNDPFTIYGTIRGPQAGSVDGYGIEATKRSSVSLAGGYHVYGVDWSPNKIVFTLDQVPYATMNHASLGPGQRWVFNRPFFLLLNLAVGGTWPGSPNSSTRFPATLRVDWVRVYQ
jgi:beta-glucanase (GH16 family)